MKEIELTFVNKENAAKFVKMLLESGVGTLAMKEDGCTCKVTYPSNENSLFDIKMCLKAIGIELV